MSFRVTFNRVFAAAHRVWNDDGKCQNIHGHNYQVTVNVESLTLTSQGFAIPFDEIKQVIDAFDHVLIVASDDPLLDQLRVLPIALVVTPFVPSTENLSQLLADRIAALHPALRVEVWLRETDGILARAEAV